MHSVMKGSSPPPTPTSIAAAAATITTTNMFLLLLLLITQSFPGVSSEPQNFMEKGSSLSVEREQDILVSPDGTFSAGFYKVGTNAYCFSIWFSASADRTVVWTANRDSPVNGRRSRISFRRSGSLVLADADDSEIWSSDPGSTAAVKAELLSSGNFVTKDLNGSIVWQSFGSPTDTLLPQQPLPKGRRLVSAKAKGALSSGYYNLVFDENNILRLLYSGPDITSLYWPNPDPGLTVYDNGRSNYNSGRLAIFDEHGRFKSTDGFTANASDTGQKLTRRLTLDHDGNLRMYSMNEPDGTWVISWAAVSYQCKVHGLCGRNGICVYTPEPRCTCPPGYEVSDPGDWSKGCRPTFNTGCSNTQNTTVFRRLLHTDFYGFDRDYYSGVSIEFCRNICLTNCSCRGFLYKRSPRPMLDGNGRCYTKYALFSGYTIPAFTGTFYLKLPGGVGVSGSSSLKAPQQLFCKAVDQNTSLTGFGVYKARSRKQMWSYFYAFATALGAVEAIFIASGCWYLRRGNAVPESSSDEGYRLMTTQFRRFTYRELSAATRGFRKELGKGSSGVVYKGALKDKRVVAVKKLEDVVQEDEEFWAETSFLGRINHMNVVRMWGFCSEGPHRLLVYEYMENRSLDKHIFDDTGTSKPLGWSQRFGIALSTARGLAYLHHECLEWVIHCDVKPENILLDANFEAKIGDFGLAKLFQRGGSVFGVSRMRGTMGYMAPEWARSLPITAKVDVYSYGVVLLEIITGTRVADWASCGGECGGEAGAWGLISEMRDRMVDGDDSWVDWVKGLLDCRLDGEISRKEATAMLRIAISCLEDDPRRRPTMDGIVEALVACQETNSHCQPAMEF